MTLKTLKNIIIVPIQTIWNTFTKRDKEQIRNNCKAMKVPYELLFKEDKNGELID